MGAERKSAVISAENAKCTAYHEAGHAVVSVLTEGSRPIHKATIVPRGNSLGMVTSLPESDETSMSLKQMVGEKYVMILIPEIPFSAQHLSYQIVPISIHGPLHGRSCRGRVGVW